MTANLWSTPKAGPSRLGPTSPAQQTQSLPTSAPESASASIYSTSVHSASGSALSGLSSARNLSNLFVRRGSLPGRRQSKSLRSGQSTSSGYMNSDEALEMTALPRSGKKLLVQEHHGARIDRRKADAAVTKWRKWIVEQPPQTTVPNGLLTNTSTSSFLFRADARRSGDTASTPTPPSTIGGFREFSGRGSVAGPSSYGSSPWNGDRASSEASHPSHQAGTTTPMSHGPSLAPGALDIYTTESVRALRDVELAVDPAWLAASTVSLSPLNRVRRLSTHPRVSPEMENPFAAIDTLLSRRRIRPLVLELVQALGAYIDAVWCTTHPNTPCPWAGVPLSIAARARRTSLTPGTAPLSKGWKSWTITSVQEGKRQGFLSSPPTEADVAFYQREIRYGLRDIDEAVNRRKDLGWAFGETVVRGQYGDIAPSNVITPDGRPSNVARLLNDLEEALWGDALPAPSDLAFEHDPTFEPFSVYREGDELIGVENQTSHEARDTELRKLFGDYYPAQAKAESGRVLEPASPTVPLSPDREMPALSSSPRSRFDESPRTPVDVAVPAMPPVPELDFSSLTVLGEMSREEQLELGRRRHQEYMERKRSEAQLVGGGVASVGE